MDGTSLWILLLAVVVAFIWFIVWASRREQINLTAAIEAKRSDILEQRQAEYRRASVLVRTPAVAPFPLEADEKAIFVGSALRVYDDGTYESPIGKVTSKTSGGLPGALLGGLLLGPVGAVAGYAVSKKTTTTAPLRTLTLKKEKRDSGKLVITSKRLVFLGSEVVSISMSSVLGFDCSSSEQRVRFMTPEARPGEYYKLNDYSYFLMSMGKAGYNVPTTSVNVPPETWGGQPSTVPGSSDAPGATTVAVPYTSLRKPKVEAAPDVPEPATESSTCMYCGQEGAEVKGLGGKRYHRACHIAKYNADLPS
jgi:hypothetical protein